MGLSAWMTAKCDNSLLQDGWVQLEHINKDGARMHYIKVGQGAPLLLIHGLLGSTYSWRYNMQGLAQTSTVYAMDLLGMGLSERVPGLDASLAASVDRMIAFMDALHLDKADIVGTSHGGALAMLMAARYPDRVGKLVLAAPANPFSTQSNSLIRFYRSSLGKWVAPQLPHLVPSLPHTLQEIALGWMYGNPAKLSTATLENYLSSLRVPYTPEHIINILKSWPNDMRAVNDSLAALRDKPMLLLWGDHDRSVELASGYKLQSHLPHAELVVLRGAGHMAYEEQPDEFNRAVRLWLEGRNPTHILDHAQNSAQSAGLPGIAGRHLRSRSAESQNGFSVT
jgi:4,5:9,10-diseco-3-hydroxy-5,9,17-trioxoandrosta-1(10),2-diene-4-oate hydrolase